jgi:hypothetical protein
MTFAASFLFKCFAYYLQNYTWSTVGNSFAIDLSSRAFALAKVISILEKSPDPDKPGHKHAFRNSLLSLETILSRLPDYLKYHFALLLNIAESESLMHNCWRIRLEWELSELVSCLRLS